MSLKSYKLKCCCISNIPFGCTLHMDIHTSKHNTDLCCTVAFIFTPQQSNRDRLFARPQQVTQMKLLWWYCKVMAGIFDVFTVLRRIRQLEKKLMITEGRLPPVREVLSRFSTKLSNAQDFVLKAASTVQEADNMNRANILKHQRNEVISPAEYHSPSLLSHPAFVGEDTLVNSSVRWPSSLQ